MSSTVIFPAQPEQILKGLGKLWTTLGQEEKGQGKPTVLRACAMTLIVATDEDDQGFTASQTISDLMKEHPSRGIVLCVNSEAEHSLEARVLAKCWKPFGKAQQICCEEIEITAKPESWPNVAPDTGGTGSCGFAGDLLVPPFGRASQRCNQGTEGRASRNCRSGPQSDIRLA